MAVATVWVCSSYTFTPRWVRPLYAVGQTVWRCDLARKGVLEAVTIKDVLLNPPDVPRVAIYRDTWNTLHPEYDLCLEAAAVAAYEAAVAAAAELAGRRYLLRLCRGLY